MKYLWHRFMHWMRIHTMALSVISLLFLFLIIYAAPSIFIFIGSGEVGVLWRRFSNGTVVDRVYDEGINLKFPWNKMYIYNIRLTQTSKTFNVLASDGLEILVDVSTRFRLIKDDVGLLHKVIGPDYIKTLLLPEVESGLRLQMSQYRPDEIYTEKRAEVEENTKEYIKSQMLFNYEPETERESFLHVENVLIKGIVLPDKVTNAIEDKLAQEQMMLGYDYRLQREEKEKERKRIEAEGIRIFQDIVKEGISEQYLKWKGINATVELASSNNTKIVIIGSGEGGLPIILGNLDQPAATPLSLPSALPSVLPSDLPTSETDKSSAVADQLQPIPTDSDAIPAEERSIVPEQQQPDMPPLEPLPR